MKKYAHVAATAALALLFGASGLAKFINPGMFRDQFAEFGLPHWFVFVTGGVELLGAVLVASFTGPQRKYGAALLAATMAVATSLHLAHDPVALAMPAFLLMLLAAYVMLRPSNPGPKAALGNG